MSAVWLRLVYIIEFLIAIPAVYTVWSQVGGQGHLDLMPWYWKLVLGLGTSLAFVALSAAVIRRERIITPRTLFWFFAVITLAGIMALTTYYYHLHESQDETESEESTTASLVVNRHLV